MNEIFRTRRKAALYANQHGLIIEETADGRYKCVEPPEQPKPDTTAFDDACDDFREICKKIGDLIGIENFRGGFDDMIIFEQSKSSTTLEGMLYGLSWSAAKERCKYEAAKIGLGQPAWWYRCWNIEKQQVEK